jgi:hypothetical protein
MAITAYILQQFINVALPVDVVAKTWFHIATKANVVATANYCSDFTLLQ